MRSLLVRDVVRAGSFSTRRTRAARPWYVVGHIVDVRQANELSVTVRMDVASVLIHESCLRNPESVEIGLARRVYLLRDKVLESFDLSDNWKWCTTTMQTNSLSSRPSFWRNLWNCLIRRVLREGETFYSKNILSSHTNISKSPVRCVQWKCHLGGQNTILM